MRARRGPTRRALLLAAVLSTALMASTGLASAEPYEDGIDPAAPTSYRATPAPLWMTGSSADRILDIAQIGNRIYVAGTFTGFRPTRNGALTRHANLAAFDANTGAPLWSFKPVLNGTVRTLAISPDGSRLYAGGSFTTVNGQPRRGMVALTAAGAVDTNWRADATGGEVRSIVATGSYLYTGGSFTAINGQARARLARLKRTNGAPDAAWRPRASASVFTIELPPGRDRVYIGGRFGSINGAPRTAYLASVSTQDGSVRTGFAAQPGREVFDVLADGSSRVWVAEGGSGGQAEAYDTAGRRLARWRTEGDTQTVELIGGRIWFGGHEQSGVYGSPMATVNPADMRWDTTTFPAPQRGGDGVWAIHASRGRLWTGGQFSNPTTGLAVFNRR